jgi:hypothetical protein
MRTNKYIPTAIEQQEDLINRPVDDESHVAFHIHISSLVSRQLFSFKPLNCREIEEYEKTRLKTPAHTQYHGRNQHQQQESECMLPSMSRERNALL